MGSKLNLPLDLPSKRFKRVSKNAWTAARIRSVLYANAPTTADYDRREGP